MKPFRPGSQRHRVLSAFFSGHRMTRFDAERIGCHALPSLVSDFESLGLTFDRRLVSVPTRWGDDAHPMQYWLNAHSYALAAELLGVDLRKHHAMTPEDAAAAYRRASGG